jgi:uncharacterized protein YndB with AHSA1/START domain
MLTCPTDVIDAPAARVWQLVSDPEALARWTDSKLRHGPSHAPPLQPGDRLVLGAGVGGLFRVQMDVLEADAPARLQLDVQLPFGVVNHETIVIKPLSPSSCRATFN